MQGDIHFRHPVCGDQHQLPAEHAHRGLRVPPSILQAAVSQRVQVSDHSSVDCIRFLIPGGEERNEQIFKNLCYARTCFLCLPQPALEKKLLLSPPCNLITYFPNSPVPQYSFSPHPNSPDALDTWSRGLASLPGFWPPWPSHCR